MSEKTCKNCKYADLDDEERPCLTCDGDLGGKHINWTHPEAEDASASAVERARREGEAEGLREAEDIARSKADCFDAMEPYYEGPKHNLCLSIADECAARAEEVER